MRRRAGGDAAGRETAEAVRKLRFRHRLHQRAAARQISVPLCPSGQVFRHRSGSGDDGCLAGRLTVAQAKSPKPGAAGTAESCCAESIDKVESASGGRSLDTAFSMAGGGSRRCLFCGGEADAEETLTVQGV